MSARLTGRGGNGRPEPVGVGSNTLDSAWERSQRGFGAHRPAAAAPRRSRRRARSPWPELRERHGRRAAGAGRGIPELDHAHGLRVGDRAGASAPRGRGGARHMRWRPTVVRGRLVTPPLPASCDRCGWFTDRVAAAARLQTFRLADEFAWSGDARRAPGRPEAVGAMTIDPHEIANISVPWSCGRLRSRRLRKGPRRRTTWPSRRLQSSAPPIESSTRFARTSSSSSTACSPRSGLAGRSPPRAGSGYRPTRSRLAGTRSSSRKGSRRRCTTHPQRGTRIESARSPPGSGKPSTAYWPTAHRGSAPTSATSTRRSTRSRPCVFGSRSRAVRGSSRSTRTSPGTAPFYIGTSPTTRWPSGSPRSRVRAPAARPALVVRVHPAEQSWGTRQPVSDALGSGTLPDNVRIVGPPTRSARTRCSG